MYIVPRASRHQDDMLTSSTAGAMNVVDAEPLDGVEFKNGVLAYITLVRFMSACLVLMFVRHY